ncbi:hypothetical protein X798_02843 [Onchocerca flexuosa]|uniref:Uncharacterized protein n=1 Tax=Onchocerca flexuosa TaxID=387005 RepID=A0A238BXJ6_9BILA|nr:hypothetical protein X798_02843 [Onchocerca flexuosa]
MRDKMRIVKEETKRLYSYANILETIVQKRLDIIQKIAITSAKKEEEKKYAENDRRSRRMKQ